MTIPASGAITLTNLQTEFGGSNPISLNEYYAGGGLVPSGTVGFPGGVSTPVPSSGAITLANFRGAGQRYFMDVLVVGGGGGGATGWPDNIGGGGGGGGGGGFGTGSSIPFVLSGFTTTINVGEGGEGGVYPLQFGLDGNPSLFTVTSAQYSSQTVSGLGGSGGKARDYSYAGGKGGDSSSSTGNAGGGYASNGGSNGVGAGGGGGGIDDSPPVGNGGNGVIWSINGTYYSGGGGGGGDYSGNSSGGLGGGGMGASASAGSNGTNGLGGGGGGGASIGGSSWLPGYKGGTGTVIVTYVNATQLLSGGTVSFSSGRWFHLFNSAGSFSLTAL